MACKTPEGEKEFREAMERRGLRIYREQTDPYRYGYEPDHWKAAEEILKENDELLISGGNRSSKTEFAAKYCVKRWMEQDIANQQRSEGSGSNAGERTRTTEESGRCTQPQPGGAVDVGNPRSGLDSTANRVDRLRLLGNGVVPHTAAKAFSTLTGRLVDVIR